MALLTPEFLHSKTYPAIRDRVAFAHGGNLQAGVWDPTELKVAQRAAGANMSTDIPFGYALIKASNSGNNGLYHIQNDATVNLAHPASHASLPRLDQIVIDVSDSIDGADAGDVPTFQVLQGTATAGATLDNRTGAASLGNNQLRLADVLVGAGVTSITTANIRDRRPWVRGFFHYQTGTPSYPTITTTYAPMLSSNGSRVRVECTGLPIRVTFNGRTIRGAGDNTFSTALFVDGVQATDSDRLQTVNGAATGYSFSQNHQWIVTPAAGSHLMEIYTKATAVDGSWTGAYVYIVEELVRPTANNGVA